jgi:hypothetical protein
MSMQFVANRENGSYVAKQDNQTVAGIYPEGDVFVASPADGIEFAPFRGTLDAAQHYVAEALGETLRASKLAQPSKRTRNVSAPQLARSSKRTSTSAPAKVPAPKVKTAPKNPAEGLSEEVLAEKMRNVGFRNRLERANGRFDVYVDSPDLLRKITKRFRNLPVHVYARGSVAPAGTANIYPNLDQAEKIATAFPGSDVAAQCIARGWKNWRIAQRESAA